MIEPSLLDRAHALSTSDHFRAALGRVMPPRVPHSVLPRSHASIHPKDQMLLHSLAHLRDPNAAVSQYFNVALQQYGVVWQILQRLFPDRLDELRVLDFACGYGRLLRFLTLGLRPGQILASEIQDECLAFVGERFGEILHLAVETADHFLLALRHGGIANSDFA